MKITSKTIRLTSLFFFILSLTLPTLTFADGFDTTISIGNVQGTVGEVVEVPVKISQPKKEIAAYGIEINFDKDSLKVVGIQSGYGSTADTCSDKAEGCFWSNYDNTAGFLRAAWADPTAGDSPINKETKLFTIQVEVIHPDYVGEKKLTVRVKDPEALSFTDASNHALSVGVEDGAFTIVEPTKEAAPEKVDKTPVKETNTGALPKTGDDSIIDTYLNIGIAVLAAVLLSMWIYKKRQNLVRK
ncbi:cohesin domain-containing protein [Neobacillus sp. 3P2-tot-E-2]|uniref:cohesin domain-containing protein n=1 Tax=Neobacillus sp. 3P2-tot-E-2 TaxID=3132212 RepID=UPI0039A387B3